MGRHALTMALHRIADVNQRAHDRERSPETTATGGRAWWISTVFNHGAANSYPDGSMWGVVDDREWLWDHVGGSRS